MMKAKWMMLLSALFPLIGMAYLYAQNAAYLMVVHMAAVTLLMMVMSLLVYGFFYLIFRNHASALAGTFVLWVMYFLFTTVGYTVLSRLIGSYTLIVMVYGVMMLAASALAAFILRRYKGEALPVIALVMTLVLLVFNLYPAIRAAVDMELGAVNTHALKTEFKTDDSLPSPNIYWIHADGMLGFDAVEAYFHDDQSTFADALTERGFLISRGAYFEAGHASALAIPSLLSPDFYDRRISPHVQTHEDAMKLRSDKRFVYHGEGAAARNDNELRLAFAGKGYFTDIISVFSKDFPWTADRFYAIERYPQPYVFPARNVDESLSSISSVKGIAKLLTKQSLSLQTIFNRMRGLAGIDFELGAPEYPLTKEEQFELLLGEGKGSAESAAMFSSMNDSLKRGNAPVLTFIFNMEPHTTFNFHADGTRIDGNPLDIVNYLGNHQYSAKLIVNLIDMIVYHDPDAVIVIQADHGLHNQSAAKIAAAFGEEAVLPLWNQVISAARIPEKFQTGEEAVMLDSPLNISRYLMNRFVGEEYSYISSEN